MYGTLPETITSSSGEGGNHRSSSETGRTHCWCQRSQWWQMACTEYQEGAAEQSITRAWPWGEREEHRNPGLAHPRKPHCTRSNRQENITSTFSTKDFLSGKRTLAKPLLPPPALSLEQQGGTTTQIFVLLNLWRPVRMEKGSPNCTSSPSPLLLHFRFFFLRKYLI